MEAIRSENTQNAQKLENLSKKFQWELERDIADYESKLKREIDDSLERGFVERLKIREKTMLAKVEEDYIFHAEKLEEDLMNYSKDLSSQLEEEKKVYRDRFESCLKNTIKKRQSRRKHLLR